MSVAGFVNLQFEIYNFHFAIRFLRRPVRLDESIYCKLKIEKCKLKIEKTNNPV
jgi:hypothetical protein